MKNCRFTYNLKKDGQGRRLAVRTARQGKERKKPPRNSGEHPVPKGKRTEKRGGVCLETLGEPLGNGCTPIIVAIAAGDVKQTSGRFPRFPGRSPPPTPKPTAGSPLRASWDLPYRQGRTRPQPTETVRSSDNRQTSTGHGGNARPPLPVGRHSASRRAEQRTAPDGLIFCVAVFAFLSHSVTRFLLR